MCQNFVGRCQQPPNRKSQPDLIRLKSHSLSQSRGFTSGLMILGPSLLLCRALGGFCPVTASKRLTQAAVTEQLGRIKEKLFHRGQSERERGAEEPVFQRVQLWEVQEIRQDRFPETNSQQAANCTRFLGNANAIAYRGAKLACKISVCFSYPIFVYPFFCELRSELIT